MKKSKFLIAVARYPCLFDKFKQLALKSIYVLTI